MNYYIDALLLEICEKLQLQPSLYQQADERYHVIADTIQADDSFKRVELKMYPHGSFRQKTTVKPLKGNEYDLDFVVELPKDSFMMPQQLYDHIYQILSGDGVHNKMVEKKARCIRVKYANDFHMDIMPGKLFDPQTREIIVPDRELKSWYHHSNPIGFSEWFESQAKTQIIMEINKAMGRQLKADAEPIDPQEIARRLEPLRRAVQLVKRYRDIYCDKHNKNAVRSIVICTLMGNISSVYSDTVDILRDFCSYVNKKIGASDGTPFEVKNPVVDEILTEKWEEDIQNYYDFVDMMRALTEDVHALYQMNVNTDIIAHLKKMFGEGVTNEAVIKYSEKISKSRKAGTLSVGTDGILNTDCVGIKVKKNTFYGD